MKARFPLHVWMMRMPTPYKSASENQTSAEDPKGGINPKDVSLKLKQDYTRASREPSIRGLDSIDSLLKHLVKDDPNLDEMLDQTTKMIYRQFGIKEVSIGLRAPPDWLYRYVCMFGMRSEIWEAHKKLAYTKEQIVDPSKYKHTVISQYTRLFLAEDNPYMEDETYTFKEHIMSISKRRVLDDSIEGDYLDVDIPGPEGEILGWIEIGSTWDGKIPSARTIRFLEIVGSILGIAIARHYAATGQKPG